MRSLSGRFLALSLKLAPPPNWRYRTSRIWLRSTNPLVCLLEKTSELQDTSATVLAVIALARIEPENPQWIDQLVESLQDSDGGVNFGAAWELGKHGEAARHAVQPLLLLAKTAQDWRTKGMAATAAWRLDSSAPNPLNSITCRMNPFIDGICLPKSLRSGMRLKSKSEKEGRGVCYVDLRSLPFYTAKLCQ